MPKPKSKTDSSSKTDAKPRMQLFDTMPTQRPQTPLLDRVDCPADLNALSTDDLLTLANELRAFLLYSAGLSGGHFGANLGVVELTIALHHVLNAPDDKIVWDVGHQAYAHKVLTGRRERLASIRAKDGLTAFPERAESEYDTFGVGHSSTSISAGLGMSLALRHLNKPATVACVIGDGAMTGGMAFEAMNDAVQQDADLLVVLNDNDMSISQATGGFSKHLAVLWQRGLAVDIDKHGDPIITKRHLSSDDRRYRHYMNMANGALTDWSQRVPTKIAEKLAETFGASKRPTVHELAEELETIPDKLANKILAEIFPDNVFKAIGFQYFGPFDGHDLLKLKQVFERVKKLRGAVLVHVHTVKGKGFAPAEADPVGYHAIAKLEPEAKPVSQTLSQQSNQQSNQSVKKKLKFSQVFGEFICDKAETDRNLMAITPAMESGSGMTEFASRYPKQFFDVAIAEQHAVTLAGGMATQGVKPIVAIYSTFLQRGYDQLIHDIALQNLDVMFAIDRAGLVGEDGATHAGVFDIAYMRCVPNMVIATPKDENDCYHLLNTCYEYPAPTAVRYPRGTGIGAKIDKNVQAHAKDYAVGKAVVEATYGDVERGGISDNNEPTRETSQKLAMLCFGTIVHTAKQVAESLSVANDALSITVVDMRWVKPLDTQLIDELLATGVTHILTLEEHAVMGGAGSAVNEYLVNQSISNVRIKNLGIPDRFISHGSHAEQLADCGLDKAGILAGVHAFL